MGDKTRSSPSNKFNSNLIIGTKMKCEEQPKKPDGDGGRGQVEDDQPMPVNDGGEVGNVDGEEGGDDFTGEEYSALDRQLDSLNSALDAIEQRNDDIQRNAKAILRE